MKAWLFGIPQSPGRDTERKPGHQGRQQWQVH
jgi:hypothetical protein